MRDKTRFLPDFTAVVRRFPVPVLASVVLCAYILMRDTAFFNLDMPMLFAAIAAFFAGGAAHLFAESRGWSLLKGLLLALPLGVLAASALYFETEFQVAPLFFFSGIVPAVMLAPFLRGHAKQGSVWLFNLRLALAALLAVVVGVVFWLGLVAVVTGLKFLLNFDFGYKSAEQIWTVAWTMVGPLYGLTLVPRNFDDEIDIASHKDSLLERGVSMLVNFVLVPLALVYALILHAYAAKIIFNGALPKGEIGAIVSLFAVGGTATWLIGWPWRDTGSAVLRWFMRGWFWLIPIPAVLLTMAIWRRVADYGVTPDRYGIALVAVWTVFVFGYLVLRRNKADMRTIIGAAAALLLVGSMGPLGAFGLTATSQFGRLKALLESVGVVKDGALVAELPKVASDKQSAGISMLQTLADYNGLGKLEPLVGKDAVTNAQKRDPWERLISIQLQLALEDRPVSQPENQVKTPDVQESQLDKFNFYSEGHVDVTWNGKVRVFGPKFYLTRFRPIVDAGANLKLELTESDFVVTIDQKRSVVPLKTFADALQGHAKTPRPWKPLQFEFSPDITMFINNASGNAGDKPSIQSVELTLVQHQ